MRGFPVCDNHYPMARARRRLIGKAPELLLSDGARIVFDPEAKMFGRPDGSLQIVGRWQRVKGPRHLSPGEVWWDNPPGPTQGVTLGTRAGAVYIAPSGVVTPTQASRLLQKSTVWIYKLIKAGRLRAVKARGRGRTRIPLRDIKRLLRFARAREPWLTG